MIHPNQGLTQEEINRKNKIGPEFANQDEVVRRAAEIKKQIKVLESEYDMLSAQVIERVKTLSAGKDKYALTVGDQGTFSLIRKRKYEYSPALQTIEAKLKEDKKIQEADGTAKVISTLEYLQFRTNDPQ